MHGLFPPKFTKENFENSVGKVWGWQTYTPDKKVFQIKGNILKIYISEVGDQRHKKHV